MADGSGVADGSGMADGSGVADGSGPDLDGDDLCRRCRAGCVVRVLGRVRQVLTR